jgi:uncharacterized protein (TIGR03085 family)
MTSYARQERAALASLLEETGPEAPTLCTGWTTRDLAAHLVVRERRPDASPGILVPALSGWTEKVRRGAAEKQSFGELVELIRQGPPKLSAFSLPGFDEAMNTSEYFVHHEDVRRAAPGWEPRELDKGLERALWRRLAATAKYALRGAPAGVRLMTPDGRETVAKPGDPMVTLTGTPGELTLYCSGRQNAARVEASGDPDAVAALARASLGV